MTEIIFHEIAPDVFVRWPSGRKVMRTFRTANLVYNDGRVVEQQVEPYEAEEKGLGRTLTTFSDAELAERKLYRAVLFEVPDGKKIVRGTERGERGKDGVVRQVFDVEDIPPPPPPPSEEEKAEDLLRRTRFASATDAMAALAALAEKERQITLEDGTTTDVDLSGEAEAR